MTVIQLPDYKIYIDGQLENAMDTIIYNITSDWDFVIVISGDRTVRIGKSVLAMNIGAYLAHRLKTPWSLSNIFMDSQQMIDAAQQMPKNSVLVYDEARETLAASKNALKLQQDLLDYFAECGQLNHVFIICLPDFFELKESFAVGRSECLINVYRTSENLMRDIYKEGKERPVVRFDRGFFEFFNRQKKQKLYDMARSMHQKNYALVKCNFLGRFTNNYTVDEHAYRQKKLQSLARFQEKKAELKVTKYDVFRDRELIRLNGMGLSASQIAEQLGHEYDYQISPSQINRILNKLKKDSETGA